MVAHIIFDLNRTLYDPETDTLVAHAADVLDACALKGVRLSLVSRREPGREDVIERFGLSARFSDVLLVSDKTPEIFSGLIEKSGIAPGDTLVVGDHPEDVRCGNACGVRTVRFRAGRFRDMNAPDAQATYEIVCLEELNRLL